MRCAKTAWTLLGFALLAGCGHQNTSLPGRLVAEYSPGKAVDVSKAPYQATYVLRQWPAPPSDPPPQRWVPEEEVVDVFTRGLERRQSVGFEKSSDGKLLAVAGEEKIPLEPGRYTWHIHPSTEYTGFKWFVHETGERTVEIVSLPFDLAVAIVSVPIAVGTLPYRLAVAFHSALRPLRSDPDVREKTTMGLQSRTLQKLMREDFPGAAPLVVAPSARAKLAADLKSRLERIEGVDTKDYGYAREEEKSRTVCSFSISDPNAYYYYANRDSFRLLLNDKDQLTFKENSYRAEDAVLVSSLDEVVEFVRHCKERLERHKALQAKRGKVRDLLAQAILAQVRKLAKEERFDFMSETDAQKLKLYVKLSDEHAVVLHIPFKDFKKFLPQLRSAIVALRQLHENGIRFQIVTRRGWPYRKTWISPE